MRLFGRLAAYSCRGRRYGKPGHTNRSSGDLNTMVARLQIKSAPRSSSVSTVSLGLSCRAFGLYMPDFNVVTPSSARPVWK